MICELAEWPRAPAGRNDETRSTTSTATREWVHGHCVVLYFEEKLQGKEIVESRAREVHKPIGEVQHC